MYGRVTIAGHPVHPGLFAYPVAGCTGTPVGFAGAPAGARWA